MSNEITAVPALLDTLAIKSCLVTLNLLKQDTTEKLGIKNKRKACGWSDRYLFHILGLIK